MLWYACTSSQAEIPYQAPHQINFSSLSPGPNIGTADQCLNLIPTDIAVTVATIHAEDIPGHIIEMIDITTGVLLNAFTPVIIIPTMTPYLTDHLHTGAHPHTLGIRGDHIPCSAYKPIKHTLHKSSMCLNRPQDQSHDKNPRVMIDDPQTDFHSSDDNSTDSKDDLDHLNLEEPSLSSVPHEWGAKHKGSNHGGTYHGLSHHYCSHWKTLQGIN